MPSSNSVTLASPLIRSITYINDSLVVTQGEDFSVPPHISQSGSTWTITLQADRSGSEDVANRFNNTVGGAYHAYAPNGGGTGKQPGTLNFYFEVIVAFYIGGNVVTQHIHLGQGHFSLTNNWWIGSNHVVNTGSPMLLVINGNTIKEILNLSGGTSSFAFAPQQ
jgi:hypothetical protein